jgi:hypothetical protein
MGGYRWGLERKRSLIAQERDAWAGDDQKKSATQATSRTRS